jgi:hypothetical protein
MEVQMFYTVYKITNLINSKIYIGVHKTDNLNDRYMGSGNNIIRAIKKYGKENFKKEYLAIFENEIDMFKMESMLVNDEFIKNEYSYNIKNGGLGSWKYVNDNLSDDYKKSKGEWLGLNFGSIGGSWDNKELRLKILESIPYDKRKKIGKKLGDEYGGRNKLNDDIIKERLNMISDIDLKQYGWVKKVSDRLNLSHTQVKRFIKKYYNGEYFIRVDKQNVA